MPARLNRKAEVDPERLPPDYVYLLGLYLGDGCLSAHPRGAADKLRVSLDSRYPKIIAAMPFAPSRPCCRATASGTCAREGCHEVYCYSKLWPQLFPQHGPGRKHERKIELVEWEEEAGLK